VYVFKYVELFALKTAWCDLNCNFLPVFFSRSRGAGAVGKRKGLGIRSVMTATFESKLNNFVQNMHLGCMPALSHYAVNFSNVLNFYCGFLPFCQQLCCFSYGRDWRRCEILPSV